MRYIQFSNKSEFDDQNQEKVKYKMFRSSSQRQQSKTLLFQTLWIKMIFCQKIFHHNIRLSTIPSLNVSTRTTHHCGKIRNL